MVVPCATGWLCFSKRRRRHRRSLRASTRLEEEEGEEGDQADAACSSRCWPEEEGKDEEPSGWVFYREQSEMHARAVAALKRDHDRDIKRVLRRSEDLAREVVALRAQLADRHARRRALREDSGVDEPPVLQVATPVRTLHPKRRSSKKAKTNVQSDVVVKVTATRGKPKAVVVGTSVVSRARRRALPAADDGEDDDELTQEETLLEHHSVDLNHAFGIMDTVDASHQVLREFHSTPAVRRCAEGSPFSAGPSSTIKPSLVPSDTSVPADLGSSVPTSSSPKRTPTPVTPPNFIMEPPPSLVAASSS
mmetsp:Transcript_17534/g.56891  ORF Transcript_17534/g.56891 Transcript_17534/m.56891 type:complete len:307 (+) Transcript_17534:55-975(+)